MSLCVCFSRIGKVVSLHPDSFPYITQFIKSAYENERKMCYYKNHALNSAALLESVNFC